MKRRPKPSKKYDHDGIDQHTRTKYETEYTINDSLKVILLQVYDILECEGLQKAEIKTLLNCLVDEHIEEIEE